jgi:NADPH:quinone reductase
MDRSLRASIGEEVAMRAVTVSEYGDTPVVGEIPTPEPGAGQVLLRMRAAGMNPMDAALASGAWRPAPATFPMVLGADGAGVVERAGGGAGRFSRGDELFGQLPTAGGAGLALVTSVEPLADKTVLIVGAGGGVGSFATQFAVNAGARVIANVRAAAAGRMRGYGAAETVDDTGVALPGALRQAHPDGIDVLIDLVSDADGFTALAALVRPGGTAVTTQYVADLGALAAASVTGTNFNFAQHVSGELLEQVAGALVGGRIVAPPITRITLEQAPAALNPAQAGGADGKTVITL